MPLPNIICMVRPYSPIGFQTAAVSLCSGIETSSIVTSIASKRAHGELLAYYEYIWMLDCVS